MRVAQSATNTERAKVNRLMWRFLRSWARIWELPEAAGGIQVEFSRRLRKSLGRSLPVHRVIRLSPLLLEASSFICCPRCSVMKQPTWPFINCTGCRADRMDQSGRDLPRQASFLGYASRSQWKTTAITRNRPGNSVLSTAVQYASSFGTPDGQPPLAVCRLLCGGS